MQKIDRLGRTPICYSIGNDPENITLEMIEKVDDIHIKDKVGYTYLHFAVMHGKCEVAKLLIKKGAKVNEVDENGLTPLNLAVNLSYGKKDSNKKIIEILLDAGANPNFKVSEDRLSPKERVKSFEDKNLIELFEKY